MATGSAWPSMNDPAFWRWLAKVGFSKYLESDRGFFLARDPFQVRDQHGNPAYNMAYLPLATAPKWCMPQVREAVRGYDPMRSVVFVIWEEGKPLLVSVLGATHLGVEPVEAYRAWCVSAGHGRLIPGEVVILKEAIDGPEHVERGAYVFLTREGVWMTLRKAVLDDNVAVQLTNDDVRVHCDFEECFSNSPGMVLRLHPVGPKKKARGKGKAGGAV